MKKWIIILIAVAAVATIVYSCRHDCQCSDNGGECSCTAENDSCGCKKAAGKAAYKHLDWNVLVFLDLSDRIDKTAAGGVDQWINDTTVLGQIVDIMDAHIWNAGAKYGKSRSIKNTEDHFKFFCYPTPSDPTINSILDNADTKFDGLNKADRPEKATSFRNTSKDAIKKIYELALADPNHADGSDLWGFFDKQVMNNCSEPGKRNILVVITDGQVYYGKNKQGFPDGTTTYMTKATMTAGKQLHVPDSVVGNLGGLEVLFLELYANNNPAELSSYHTILDTWLKGMGVRKFVILDADLPTNNKAAIENFFAE